MTCRVIPFRNYKIIMNGFEGFVGIPMSGEQTPSDLLFASLLLSLMLFAGIFSLNYPFFFQMIRTIILPNRRSFSVEAKKGNATLFHLFMNVQTIFLAAFTLFEILKSGYLIPISSHPQPFYLGILLLTLTLFYLLKQSLYILLSYIFTNRESFIIWRNMYNAVFESYGVLLYLPAFGLVFASSYAYYFSILFSILYIACRFVIIYKTLDIFYQKRMSWFYLSLYLCAQEIVPLLLLFKGFINLYNFFESSTLWR